MKIGIYENYNFEDGKITGNGRFRYVWDLEEDHKDYFFLNDIKDLTRFKKYESHRGLDILRSLTRLYGIISNGTFQEDKFVGVYYMESGEVDNEWIHAESVSFSECYNMYKALITKDKISTTEKKNFICKLNEGMKHVNIKYEVDVSGKIEEIFEPLNIFGIAYLKVKHLFFNSLQFKQCANCERYFTYRNERERFCCSSCSTSYRQRKNNVKKDYKKGLSIDEIAEKRSGSSEKEITEWIEEWKGAAE